MDHGTYKLWSYSVHIVFDSTISFRNASKKVTPSLLPVYHLRDHVHGILQNIMRGCMAPGTNISTTRKGSTLRTGELNGVSTGGKRHDNPTLFAGNLRIMVEAAERLVDDAITRAKDGAIEIMYVGGDHKCWRSDGTG
eukprot:3603857-Pyramimonas_sp.AAC.1